ncbi:MAG: hypothetical protein ACE5IM_03535 [Nitrospinota bacterium]
MLRRLGFLLLTGVWLLPPLLAGCAAQPDLVLRKIIRKEGFSLSGHSERTLRSITLVFRELEADDRPQ